MEYATKLVVKTHVVKRGETLSKIASKYGVGIADIKKWNKLKNNTIARGKKLKIHSYERVATGRKKSEPIIASAESQSASTITSDSVPADSSAVMTTVPELAKAEAVEDSKEVKKETSVAKNTPKATKAKKSSTPSIRYHTVKKGESLFRIAKKYKGVTVADIQELNGLSGSDIKIGQKLKIPRS